MSLESIPRSLRVPERSFFLFGARGTGKSTWLRQALPGAVRFDLLSASTQTHLTREPRALEYLVGNRPAGTWVVLDEIQKVPALLDEVHRLIEEKRWRFALCGSSARKLKREGSNLLGGRALTLSMEGFTSAEVGESFDLARALRWGTLPVLGGDEALAPDVLSAYVNTYLKEEIREEGLVRRVPPFLRFLQIAGQVNGQVVNLANLARDSGNSRSSVEAWFGILTDTLLGHFLPAWQPRLKVREQTHPKFYWFDPGVARAVAAWERDPVANDWLGHALETLLFHELRVYNQVSGRHRPLAYYGTAAGGEVDFVIETRKATAAQGPEVVLVEVKLADKWNHQWDRGMRDLAGRKGLQVKAMYGVYLGQTTYHVNGIDVLPAPAFLRALHAGGIF